MKIMNLLTSMISTFEEFKMSDERIEFDRLKTSQSTI
jgi:hypothetical protein